MHCCTVWKEHYEKAAELDERIDFHTLYSKQTPADKQNDFYLTASTHLCAVRPLSLIQLPDGSVEETRGLMQVRHKWEEFLKSEMWKLVNIEQGRSRECSGIAVI